MKGLAWVFAALVGAAACAPFALARPVYREQAIRQLHLKGSVLSRSTMACTYCHVQDRGGAPWNPFGEALKAGFREHPKSKFAEVLSLVLAENQDADKDGYSDALEIFARTLPGDPKSVPDEALDTLQQRFEKAGGAAQYRPAGKTETTSTSSTATNSSR